MKIFTKIERDRYIDSLETLSETAILNEQPGIETGYVGMATNVFKDVIEEIGLSTPEIEACTEADYVIVASAESEEAFTKAVETVWAESAPTDDTEKPESYLSSAAAKEAEPRANLCQISVPGEYALEEVKKALNAGMHCCVFSNNVPLEQEREMKELAREKGLLCMHWCSPASTTEDPSELWALPAQEFSMWQQFFMRQEAASVRPSAPAGMT